MGRPGDFLLAVEWLGWRHRSEKAARLGRLRPVLLGAVLMVAVGAAVFAGGCTVGPNYKRPAAVAPAKWDVAEPWRESAPKDAFPKGDWWSVFHDHDLNALEKQALLENQTIKVSLEHLEQAGETAPIHMA